MGEDMSGKYMGELYVRLPREVDLLLEFRERFGGGCEKRRFTAVEVSRSTRSSLWLYV